MDFDKVLEEIGGRGRVQYRMFWLHFVSQAVASLNVFVHMFMQSDGNYRCHVHGCDAALLSESEYEKDWLNLTIPYTFEERSEKHILDRCHTFDYNFTAAMNGTNCEFHAFLKGNLIPCKKFIYQSTTDTLTKEWNLTCDDSYLLTLSMSFFMAGFLVGVYTFGFISDRFGRRRAILISGYILMSCNLAVIFSVNLYMYLVLRFFIAASSLGILTITYVLLSEMIGTKDRFLLSFGAGGWVVGEYLIVLFAYFIRNWRYLQAAVSIVSFLYIVNFWLVYESPRWLISQKKFKEAKSEITKICKCQRKEVNSGLLEFYKVPDKDEVVDEAKYTPFDLFRTYVIRKRIILISLIWFADSLITYSIALGAQNMPGSIHVNFACLATAEVAAICVLYGLVKYVKRVLTTSTAMFAVGIFCLSNLAINAADIWLTVTFAMVGHFMVSIVFALTYMITAELFPTPLRSAAMGTGSMFSRVGGIAAPFVISLIDIWRPLPSLIVGTCGLVSGLVILFLPETLDKPLPNTVQDVEVTRSKSNAISMACWKFIPANTATEVAGDQCKEKEEESML